MSDLLVRFYAGAAAAAGTEDETLSPPEGADVSWLHDELLRRHPDIAPVLLAASLLVDGVAVTDRAHVLDGASSVDVLPPFAGG